jgi:hypothetical protein
MGNRAKFLEISAELAELERLECQLASSTRNFRAGTIELALILCCFSIVALWFLIIAADKLKDTCIRNQIARGFQRRLDQNILKVHEDFSEYRAVLDPCFVRGCFGRFQPVRPNDFQRLIPKRNLKEALAALDIHLESEQEINDLFFVMDMDDNKGLDFDEFKKALQASACYRELKVSTKHFRKLSWSH